MVNQNIEIINPDDKDYYDSKLYQVGIWPGAGYQLATFNVYADNEQTALELVVANAELNAQGLLMSIPEMEEMIMEDWHDECEAFIDENSYREADEYTFAEEYLNYIYVDATMEGASQPYFVTGENLSIEEITNTVNENKTSEYNTPHYIAKCTLETPDEIPNVYLLLDEKTSSGISGLDIILAESIFKNLMYNTDYNVKDLEIVKEVYTLTELVEYMKTQGIDLSNMVTDKGIPVGMGDMLPEDLNHYIIGEEGDPTLEENKEIKEEAKLTDYLGILQIRDILQQNKETADKEFAILDDMKVEVGTGDNTKIYKATKNADDEWELTQIKNENKTLIENSQETGNIVWENIDEYSQDEIDEIRNILDSLVVEAVKRDGHSVAVKIKSNGMIFWLDYTQQGDDIAGDWNQYIFNTTNSNDRIRQAIQTSYIENDGYSVAFEEMESEGFSYLQEQGVIKYVDNKFIFTDLTENKNLNETYNQDGFPNSEELQDYFTKQGTLPDSIKLDNIKYTMTEYGGTGDNSWVIYTDNDNVDSYIKVFYSMNKVGDDQYKGVKDILGVSDLREVKEIKKEYYAKSDDEHIIWDSEFDITNYDMEDLKDTYYQDYLDNFDETVTPLSYDNWLDSDNCAMYFDLMWEQAAQENDYYAEWYEFITEYVSDEEKQGAYDEYVENFKNNKPKPKSFESWLDDNINQLSEDDWQVKEGDLEVNILPTIESQINYDTLILTGYYGSNYPDFRSSGEGGKMFDSVEDFRHYMGEFDEVCITTKNGILGSILSDHDGTVSGQFYTLPENLTELVKAINYEQYVDISEDITDEDEIFEIVMDQFEEALVYGGIEVRDLTSHIDLLVPIKDTISGYTPDPEPKKENKEKDDDNKYCIICGKEKEDYEASLCDDCWEKEQQRLKGKKVEDKDTKLKELEAVEYISKKEYDEMPEDYKTTIAKTLQARQAVGDNVEKLKQLYKNLGYNETDPMILAYEKGGTVLKPVKIQESKMSEFDIDVQNTLKQFDDFLKNEGYTEVDDDIVNEFFTEIFYNIDTEEEMEVMNEAEKQIRQKYGLKESKVPRTLKDKVLTEEDENMQEVENDIQTARENSENDTLSIEQIASSIDVLLVDEQGAIDGYKSYLEQAKQVISEELYQELNTQLQEIIDDEEEHIEKLNTIKDTLLGNTDNTPVTDIENTDEILNLEVEEELTETVEQNTNGKISEELNTGTLPVVNVDMYSLSDDLYQYDIDEQELDNIVMEVAPKYIEDTISEILPNVSVIAKSVYHPKQYNFAGDELEFELVLDSASYNELKDKTLNNPDFTKFLKDNYSSRDGFVSYMADNLDDFNTQDNWKQMVQIIMFNIPEDRINLNNEQYIDEFLEKVHMSANIDSIDETKSLKTENKEQWVNNWEELNSMIEYYAENEGFTLTDDDLYNITNNLAEQGILDTFEDFKANNEAKDIIITAIEQFPNKVEENKDDDFPYDNTTEKKCPNCGKSYTEFPALSRKDNKTYICPQCGVDEAMSDYHKSIKKEDNSSDKETEFKVGDVVTDLVDSDLAVIEEIDDTRKAKYLLRFVSNPVMGEAFWYEPGRFEKETDEQNIKNALDIYNRNMKK